MTSYHHILNTHTERLHDREIILESSYDQFLISPKSMYYIKD